MSNILSKSSDKSQILAFGFPVTLTSHSLATEHYALNCLCCLTILLKKGIFNYGISMNLGALVYNCNSSANQDDKYVTTKNSTDKNGMLLLLLIVTLMHI
jgi:hypothetical protein